MKSADIRGFCRGTIGRKIRMKSAILALDHYEGNENVMKGQRYVPVEREASAA